jgi:hypothetical protein
MATVSNNSYQATEHQINTGETRIPAKWTWALDNSSHTAGQALSLVETISGAARVDGFSTRAVTCRLSYAVTSGTPAPKDIVLYLISKQSIPTTTPVLSADQAFTQTDVGYILGTISVATADWIIYDKIATVNKTIDIDCINEDSTAGTSIYCFALNGATTWTPAASSQLGVYLWFKMS